MKRNWLTAAAAAALLALAGTAALAQEQGHPRFDDHDQQVTRDWYNHRRGRGKL